MFIGITSILTQLVHKPVECIRHIFWCILGHEENIGSIRTTLSHIMVPKVQAISYLGDHFWWGTGCKCQYTCRCEEAAELHQTAVVFSEALPPESGQTYYISGFLELCVIYSDGSDWI